MYYDNIVRPLLRNIKKFLFIYDCSNRKSFVNLKTWIERVKEINGNDIKGLVVSNKCDFNIKEVSLEEGLEFANQNGLEFYSTSVKNYREIRELFLDIIMK